MFPMMSEVVNCMFHQNEPDDFIIPISLSNVQYFDLLCLADLTPSLRSFIYDICSWTPCCTCFVPSSLFLLLVGLASSWSDFSLHCAGYSNCVELYCSHRVICMTALPSWFQCFSPVYQLDKFRVSTMHHACCCLSGWFRFSAPFSLSSVLGPGLVMMLFAGQSSIPCLAVYFRSPVRIVRRASLPFIAAGFF